VIAPEVVVADELTDRSLQIFRHIVWHLVDVSFQRLVVALRLPVCLWVVRRGQDVPDAEDLQVLPKQSRDVPWSVVREKPGPILHRYVAHPLAFGRQQIAIGGYLANVLNDRDLAKKVMESIAELLSVSSADELQQGLYVLHMGIAWAAVTDRDHKIAKEAASQLLPYSGQIEPSLICSIDHLIGVVAELSGDTIEAAGRYERAIQMLRDAGYRPELAWTCFDYTEMLLKRDDRDDREKATKLQDKTMAIATELGMKPQLERVLAQREMLGA
jgi:hypothetical protein